MSTMTIQGFRLSAQQRRLWQQHGHGPAYCVQEAMSIRGAVDAARLRSALEQVVARHEALRTTYRRRPGMKLPIQTPTANGENVQFEERPITEPITLDLAARRLERLRRRPFDLEVGPLLSAHLLSRSAEEHLLLLSMPALAADGRSLDVVLGELERAYHSELPPANDEDPLQYVHFSEWQEELAGASDDEATSGRERWRRDEAAAAESGLDLPGLAPPSARPRFDLRIHRQELETALAERLVNLAAERGVELEVIFCAAWATLLARLGNSPRAALRWRFDNRPFEDLERAVGLFAKHLPIVVHTSAELSFGGLVEQLRESARQAGDWQEYAALDDADGSVDLPLFAFDDTAPTRQLGELRLERLDRYVWPHAAPVALTAQRTAAGYSLALAYDGRRLSSEEAALLGDRLLRLLSSVVTGWKRPLADLELLTDTERARLAILGGLPFDPPPALTVIDRVARRVAEDGSRPAVVSGDRSLTYGELWLRAGRLAVALERAGVSAEEPVGLLLERDVDTVAALLGVWRAGGAYLPLDPGLPGRRLSRLMATAAVRVVVASAATLPLVPERVEAVNVATIADGSAPADPSSPVPVPSQLAYVLFTSGSTGVPKGVMVEHRQLASYVAAAEERLALDEVTSWALASTFAADLGNTALFPALCRGGVVHVVSAEEATGPAAFARVMAGGAVEGLKIVPSHLRALMSGDSPESILPSRLLVLGGEACDGELLARVRQLAPRLRIVNHYGPTEATVGATADTVPAEHDPGQPIPLGRPLANSLSVILDRRGRTAPLGVVGELCLGGAGVARGYLGSASATAERFVPDAWSGRFGARLYRTGDRARIGASGLEFRGRVDHQVKLRGFRVELGEIETLLRQHRDVEEAVVALRQDGEQGPRLVAYAVPRPGTRPEADTLRRALAEELPEAMVPSALVVVERLPLNANGKVDRGALPAVEEAATATEYEAPRDAREETLARIWSKVLGVPRVGIRDGFFALGGDSILAIQAVGQANREGLALTPQLLFRHQTIAELAPQVVAAERSPSGDGPVVGPGVLTPIQRWFFDYGFRRPERWNQSFLFEIGEAILDLAALKRSVELLVEHHDGLRAGFDRGQGGVELHFAAPGGETPFAVINLGRLADDERQPALRAAAAEVQGSFRLDRPPLLRVVWLAGSKPADGRLLIVAHHLVIDGVSWRVLLEDLEACYRALARRRRPELPARTTSVRDWGERLERLADGPEMAAERDAWLSLPTDATPGLPPDRAGENNMASAGAIGRAFPEDSTRDLLRKVPAAYGTRIDEVLLTALARAVAPWIGDRPLLVELEGHGRESFADVDLSRTVGWFTSHYPVLLPAVGDDPPGTALVRVKESLRSIPGGGLGFGVLRYLSEDPATRETLAALPEPTLGFNYLGQLDRVLGSTGPFKVASEVLAGDTDPAERRPRHIDLGISVVAERLQIRFTFSEALYERATLERLIKRYLACLEELVEHCRAPGAGAHTPSDFPLAGLDFESLAALETRLQCLDGGGAGGGRADIEDLYPMTPLQESLLYHVLSVPGSGVGFEQSVSTLAGELDRGAFDATWRRVVERHPILRTSVVTSGVERPLERVRRRVEMVIDHRDWSDRSPVQQQQRLETFLAEDRRRGFDLERAPLMRVALIRLADDRHQFVWSYHHLILDGWCRGLVLDEVFALYDAYRRGTTPSLPRRRPFRDYVEWLQRQDQGEAEGFWRRTVGDLEAPTELAVDRLAERSLEGERYRWQDGELDETTSERLEAFARRHGLTLNSLVQGTWALLASRYSGQKRVVHGTTVSGRPTDLEGAETMLGMFVNNLPVCLEVDEDAVASEWFRGVQEQLVELRRFEFLSPAEIQEWSGLGTSRRLFDVLVLFQNYPIGDVGEELESRSLRIEDYRSRLETNYALTLGIGRARPLVLRLFYDAHRFDAGSVGRMMSHLRHLLHGLATEDDPRLRDLALEERPPAQPVAAEAPAEDPLANLGTALPASSWLWLDDATLEGAAVRRRARALARSLRRSGVVPGTRVGVWVEAEAELPALLLAVLETGGVLVCLDPRRGDDVAGRGLDIVVRRADGPGAESGAVTLWSPAPHTALDAVKDAAAPPVPAAAPAFETRLRSGLVVRFSRAGLARRLETLAACLGAGDRLLTGAGDAESTAFDALLAISSGAGLRLSAAIPADVVGAGGVTAWRATPGHWVAALARGWRPAPGFRALCSRERPAAGLVAALAEAGAEVWRVDLEAAQAARLDGGAAAPEPAGDLVEVVVDSRLRPTVPGVPGEIVLAGASVPVADGTEGPLRTGRRGRRLPAGEIEDLGRVGASAAERRCTEIEALLERHPAVFQARMTRPASGALDAGVVFVAGRPQAEPAALRSYLARVLPPEWLPGGFVPVPSLPLDAAGAVDRSALSELDLADLEESFVAPRSPRQLALVRLFEELFDRRPIGIRKSFFELGGHSLMALRLLDRVRNVFDVDLPLDILLQASTVEALAERIAAAERAGSSAGAWHPLVSIAPDGDRPPVFCVHPGGGNVLCYVDLAYRLGDRQPIYGLEARGREAGERPMENVAEMARTYVEAIREIQPEGPYRLAGWSFGGLVAFEMACQLRAAAQEVAWLAVFDTLLREGEYPLDDSELLHGYLGEELPIPLSELLSRGDIEQQLTYAIGRAKEEGFLPADYPLAKAKRLFEVRRSNIRAGVAYTPGSLDAPLVLFRARGREEEGLAADYGWGRHASHVVVREVPGDHATMMRPPHVEGLARELGEWLG